MGGKGGKKRKGGMAVPSFGAGGLRTPSPTPSVGDERQRMRGVGVGRRGMRGRRSREWWRRRVWLGWMLWLSRWIGFIWG